MGGRAAAAADMEAAAVRARVAAAEVTVAARAVSSAAARMEVAVVREGVAEMVVLAVMAVNAAAAAATAAAAVTAAVVKVEAAQGEEVAVAMGQGTVAVARLPSLDGGGISQVPCRTRNAQKCRSACNGCAFALCVSCSHRTCERSHLPHASTVPHQCPHSCSQ